MKAVKQQPFKCWTWQQKVQFPKWRQAAAAGRQTSRVRRWRAAAGRWGQWPDWWDTHSWPGCCCRARLAAAGSWWPGHSPSCGLRAGPRLPGCVASSSTLYLYCAVLHISSAGPGPSCLLRPQHFLKPLVTFARKTTERIDICKSRQMQPNSFYWLTDQHRIGWIQERDWLGGSQPQYAGPDLLIK